MKKSIPLKEIVGFLPYELTVIRNSWVTESESKKVILNGKILDLFVLGKYKEFKPIVRPLSDLTKPITHNGETFVPIDKISELFFDDLNIQRNETTGNLEIIMITNDYSHEIDFFVGGEIIEQLKEWLFDIYDWIKDGLAVDINTI